MEAKELRIGNYVYSGINSKDVIQVYPMFLVQLSKIENEQNNIKPIPLTEEWLLKFGAYNDSGYCISDLKIYVGTLLDFYLEFNINEGGNVTSSYLIRYGCIADRTEDIYTETDIKYVHTLQNFIFALTGKELTINE